MFLNIGDQVTVEDLLRGVIVQSGNDACIVLAEGLAGTEERFAEQMTEHARQIGLAHSTFKNASGLPQPGHVTTARDLAKLAKSTIEKFPQFYPMYAEKEFRYNGIKQGNRNPLLYKSMGVDGLKTGHAEEAGYGLTASAKRGDRRLILVVNGLKSMNERSRETERLMEIGFREFDNYKLFAGGAEIDQADVWLGEKTRVPLVVEKDVVQTLPRAKRADLKVAAVYDNPLPAPIRKGTPVGRLVISGPGIEAREVALVAGADVARLGAFGRIGAAISYLIWGPGRS
jgi:D-alanyl-D-alanine carboxypeptidase (penicillin-binding protein 5/6)